MAATVTVKVDSKNFAKGVKYAKAFGGRFDHTSKTWAIPASRPELGNIRAYYLIPTTPVVRDENGNAECFAGTWQQGWS